jgi:4-hydroxymandelate oxidase
MHCILNPVHGNEALNRRLACFGRADCREECLDSVDFDALEARARECLSAGAYAFAATGAVDEITCAENALAWQRLRLRPHVLRDITSIDTRTHVLGAPVATPIMVAPTGRHRLYHAEGEEATARGAAAVGSAFVLATASTVRMETVAAARKSAPQWFQLYMPPDRAETEAIIDRAAAAGFRAIVLTVDQPVPGASPRAMRHPVEANPDIRHVNLPGEPIARTAYDATFEGVVRYPTTVRDLAWMVGRTPLDVVVKGVLRGDDARRCVEAGAKAIIVSNHGGRHLDTTVTTAEALPEIVAAVGNAAEIYVDGGLRRGTDILKALALGARAVLIGRPVLWALTLDGADGVCSVLEHLRSELARSMALCGAASLDALTPDLVAGQATFR